MELLHTNIHFSLLHASWLKRHTTSALSSPLHTTIIECPLLSITALHEHTNCKNNNTSMPPQERHRSHRLQMKFNVLFSSHQLPTLGKHKSDCIRKESSHSSFFKIQERYAKRNSRDLWALSAMIWISAVWQCMMLFGRRQGSPSKQKLQHGRPRDFQERGMQKMQLEKM